MVFLFIILGLITLYIGADILVRYSSHLAATLGITPLIIGLTVVAYGTSTPELIVNIVASLSNTTDIALGNVLGSNIFNVLFILGISAIISPLIVHKQFIYLDVPVMIAASLMTWFVARSGHIGWKVGVIFLLLIIGYTIVLIFLAKKNQTTTPIKKERLSYRLLFKDIFFIIGSLIILVAGSKLLVEGSINLARLMGVSELLISLTIVAAGTSFPELATSVVAALRGERDIAVGNIVGSNIYNLWAILGISAILAPHGIPVPEVALSFDIPVMVAISIACLPIFFTHHAIYRWEGGLFLGFYCAYIIYLIMYETHHYFLGAFQDAMLFFFFPLIAITLAIGVFRYKKN